MKVLAFAASNHSQSINRMFAQLAAQRFKDKFKPEAEIEMVDLNDYEMPIYSVDRENNEGIPSLAKDLFAKMGEADVLIISYPEYNGSYSSAWKNIHDWMSRISPKIYHGKPLLALAATPGPRAGAGVLDAVGFSAPYFAGDLRGKVGVGLWWGAYDADTASLTNDENIEALDAALTELAKPSA